MKLKTDMTPFILVTTALLWQSAGLSWWAFAALLLLTPPATEGVNWLIGWLRSKPQPPAAMPDLPTPLRIKKILRPAPFEDHVDTVD